MAIRTPNRMQVEINIAGNVFLMTYDLPDVTGLIHEPDWNNKWLDEAVRVALQAKLGKMVPVWR